MRHEKTIYKHCRSLFRYNLFNPQIWVSFYIMILQSNRFLMINLLSFLVPLIPPVIADLFPFVNFKTSNVLFIGQWKKIFLINFDKRISSINQYPIPLLVIRFEDKTYYQMYWIHCGIRLSSEYRYSIYCNFFPYCPQKISLFAPNPCQFRLLITLK